MQKLIHNIWKPVQVHKKDLDNMFVGSLLVTYLSYEPLVVGSVCPERVIRASIH